MKPKEDKITGTLNRFLDHLGDPVAAELEKSITARTLHRLQSGSVPEPLKMMIKTNILSNRVNTSAFCCFFNLEERMSSITVSVMTQPAARRIEEIFTEHYQLVYRTACAITRNPDDAEDVLQEVFVRLLAKGVPRDLKNPKAYFYTAAVRASLNVLRTRRRFVFADDAGIFETAYHEDTPGIDDTVRSELSQAIANLSPRTVEILMLRYAEDLTEPQIAKLLGRSRGTVAVTLFRGLARLRKLLRRS